MTYKFLRTTALATSLLASTYAEKPFDTLDADHDNKITMSDALEMGKKYTAGDKTQLPLLHEIYSYLKVKNSWRDFYMKVAPDALDADGNGEVNVIDVQIRTNQILAGDYKKKPLQRLTLETALGRKITQAEYAAFEATAAKK